MPPGKKPRRADLPHLVVKHYKRKDGKESTYYYHRRTSKRIHGEFGSEEFLANYLSASKIERGPIDQTTLGGLLDHYRQSKAYTSLADNSKRNYEPILARIRDEWSSMPLTVIEDRSVREGILEIRDQIALRSKRQADYYVSVLSAVLSHGVDIGRITNNHAIGIKKVYKANRSERIWLPEDVRAFEAVASPQLRYALLLGLHTGQRQSDLLNLPWSAFDGQGISLTQSKTGIDVYVPCTQALMSMLNLMPRVSTIIMTNTRDMPWSTDGFKTSWRKAAIKAGIQGKLTFHDLRGTTVTMLAEAGCSVPQIATITGHSIASANHIIERYMARTKHMAKAAIVMLDAHRAGSN